MSGPASSEQHHAEAGQRRRADRNATFVPAEIRYPYDADPRARHHWVGAAWDAVWALLDTDPWLWWPATHLVQAMRDARPEISTNLARDKLKRACRAGALYVHHVPTPIGRRGKTTTIDYFRSAVHDAAEPPERMRLADLETGAPAQARSRSFEGEAP